MAGPPKGGGIQQQTEINFVFEATEEGGWKMRLPELMKDAKAEPKG